MSCSPWGREELDMTERLSTQMPAAIPPLPAPPG